VKAQPLNDKYPRTGAGLVAFLDYAMRRSLVAPNAGAGQKTACLEVLPVALGPDWQAADVLSPNVDWLLDEFQRARGRKLAPSGVERYRERLLGAIELFRAHAEPARTDRPMPTPEPWVPDSDSVMPDGQQGLPDRGDTEAPGEDNAESDFDEGQHETMTRSAHEPRHDGSEEGVDTLTYPFPLRPGVVVTMRFPVDLTTEESRRLARFIESLTVEPVAAARPSKHVGRASANGAVRRRAAAGSKTTSLRSSSSRTAAKAGKAT
jgi:hypothetical protein